MKILITGSRTWGNVELITTVITECLSEATLAQENLIIVHGNARGADQISDSIARELGAMTIPMDPDWCTYGRSAGFIRNGEMLNVHKDISRVYAFIARDGSLGTEDMIDRAKRRGIPVTVYRDDPKPPSEVR